MLSTVYNNCLSTFYQHVGYTVSTFLFTFVSAICQLLSTCCPHVINVCPHCVNIMSTCCPHVVHMWSTCCAHFYTVCRRLLMFCQLLVFVNFINFCVILCTDCKPFCQPLCALLSSGVVYASGGDLAIRGSGAGADSGSEVWIQGF